METNPILPQPIQKKNKMHIVAMLILAFLVTGLGYYIPMESHLSGQFCTTRAYGLPLKIQDRLIVEKVELINPSTGRAVQTDCIQSAAGTSRIETTSINWVNWILNFIIFAVLFGLIGYLVMLTRWYWYALLPIIYLLAFLVGKILQSSGTKVTT
jgi:hypothetical protein